MSTVPGHPRITINPNILVAKPTIRGMRISVEQVLRALGNGVTYADLLMDYPDLEEDDIQACQAYAAERISDERIYSVPVGSS